MIHRANTSSRFALFSNLAASLLLIFASGCATCKFFSKSPEQERADRQDQLRGTLATYCSAPHLPDGRVDVEKLVKELVDVHANTYSFCIHTSSNDWDDLQLFLPLARKQGIKVWGSIVPPSESPPRAKLYAEPFKLDYDRWAIEFAKLSLRETNLVAWSIDDFTHNLKVYTPVQVNQMLTAARKVNPKLAFVPCCYYKAITPQFVTNYCPLLDGLLFPYRDESHGANLKNPDNVEFEVNKIKEMTGYSYPVIFDVYATKHSSLGSTTPDYVETAMTLGHRSADGVMVYCHQDPQLNREKHGVVKRLFTGWAGE
ncbi:hypothetical protein [Pedosphaera parvula]|uniref:DUF4015 domain-containing protein n=1 Tax=Pedosphaera parvula (strain Ellin514) TaxID=320771 RepID=B9XLT0_PEDPL|nr:hypothetical protein [Pedosphaera parvula]EEF59187.1 hypothetical protein Cflav_PD2392 [Pedosphaera parvula Ellin514]